MTVRISRRDFFEKSGLAALVLAINNNDSNAQVADGGQSVVEQIQNEVSGLKFGYRSRNALLMEAQGPNNSLERTLNLYSDGWKAQIRVPYSYNEELDFGFIVGLTETQYILSIDGSEVKVSRRPNQSRKIGLPADSAVFSYNRPKPNNPRLPEMKIYFQDGNHKFDSLSIELAGQQILYQISEFLKLLPSKK